MSNSKRDILLFQYNWRGVWNKALSDSWSNVKFSLWFGNIHKENWKENLAVHHKSLGALFQAPLQFLNRIHACWDNGVLAISSIVDICVCLKAILLLAYFIIMWCWSAPGSSHKILVGIANGSLVPFTYLGRETHCRRKFIFWENNMIPCTDQPWTSKLP